LKQTNDNYKYLKFGRTYGQEERVNQHMPRRDLAWIVTVL